MTTKAGSNSKNVDPGSRLALHAETPGQRKGKGAAPRPERPLRAFRSASRSSIEGEHAAGKLSASNALTVKKIK